MKAVVKRKRPRLTPHHRKERLDFAIRHQHCLEDWKKLDWSDENRINHLGSDGRKWVWKKAGEGLSDRLVEGTLKFGGRSLMIWGCMLWEGVRDACKIDGRTDGDLYIKILEDDLQNSLAFYDKTPWPSSSSRMMILNTLARRLKIGSKTLIWKSYHGLHNLQT